MRTEAEVRAMVGRFERFNDKHLQRICSGVTEEDCGEVAVVFNSNSSMLCALRWVLGEDTISVQQNASAKVGPA